MSLNDNFKNVFLSKKVDLIKIDFKWSIPKFCVIVRFKVKDHFLVVALGDSHAKEQSFTKALKYSLTILAVFSCSNFCLFVQMKKPKPI